MTLAGTSGGTYALTSKTTPSSLKSMLISDITSNMTALYNNVKTDPAKVAALSSSTTNLGLSSYNLTFQNGSDSVTLNLNLNNVNYSDIISSTDYASSSTTPLTSDFSAKVAAYIDDNLTHFLGSSLEISANGATDQSLSLNQNSVKENVITNVPVVGGYDLGLKIQAGAFANDSIDIKYQYLRNGSIGIMTLNTLTSESSSAAIAQVDSAIDKVSKQRALFGAYTNRLNSAYSNNCNTSENLQSAESLLRDTDIAKEMVSYGKHSIIEQAGQSMLAQANQISNGVLTLLKQ